MALTKEDLKAIAQIMDEKVEPINRRLDGIDERLDGIDERLDGIDERLNRVDERLDGIDERLDGIDERLDGIEEDVGILKGATNEILEWFDTYQRNDFDKPFPVDEKDAV